MPVKLSREYDEEGIVIRVTADTYSAEVSLQRLIRKLDEFQTRATGKIFPAIGQVFNASIASQKQFLDSYSNFVKNFENINKMWLAATEKQKPDIAKALGLEPRALELLLKKSESIISESAGKINLLRAMFGKPTPTEFVSSLGAAKRELESLATVIPQLQQIQKLPYDVRLKTIPTVFGEAFAGPLGMKAFSTMVDDLVKRRDALQKSIVAFNQAAVPTGFFNKLKYHTLEVAKSFQEAYASGMGLSRGLFAITTRAIFLVSVLGVLFSTVNLIRNTIYGLVRAFEDFTQTISAFAGIAMTFSQRLPGETAGEHFLRAYNYAKQLYATMEDIAATTLMTGEQANLMARQFLQAGVIIDVTSQKQKEGLQTIANVLFLLTQGQNQNIQIISELRNLLHGIITPREVFGTLLKSLDPNIQEKIKQWKKLGSEAIIGGIADLLKGMEIATLRISRSWTAISNAFATTIVRLTRPAIEVVYDYVVSLVEGMNNRLKEGGAEFQFMMIQIGQSIVKILEHIVKIIEFLYKIRDIIKIIIALIVGMFIGRIIGEIGAALLRFIGILAQLRASITTIRSIGVAIRDVLFIPRNFLAFMIGAGGVVGAALATAFTFIDLIKGSSEGWKDSIDTILDKYDIVSIKVSKISDEIRTIAENTRRISPNLRDFTTEELATLYEAGRLEISTSPSSAAAWLVQLPDMEEDISNYMKVFTERIKTSETEAKALTMHFKAIKESILESSLLLNKEYRDLREIVSAQVLILEKRREQALINKEDTSEIDKQLGKYRKQMELLNKIEAIRAKVPKEKLSEFLYVPSISLLSQLDQLERQFPEFKGLKEKISKTVFLGFLEGWYDVQELVNKKGLTVGVEFVLKETSPLYQLFSIGPNTPLEERKRILESINKEMSKFSLASRQLAGEGDRNKALREAEQYVRRFLTLQNEYLEIIRKQNEAKVKQLEFERDLNSILLERESIIEGAAIEREINFLQTAYNLGAIAVDVYYSRMMELTKKQSELEQKRIKENWEYEKKVLEARIGFREQELKILQAQEALAYSRLARQIQEITKKSATVVKSFIDDIIREVESGDLTPEGFVKVIEKFIGKGEQAENVMSLIKNFMDLRNRIIDAANAVTELKNELTKTDEKVKNDLIRNTEDLKTKQDSLTMQHLIDQAKSFNKELDTMAQKLELIDIKLKIAEFKGDWMEYYRAQLEKLEAERKQAGLKYTQQGMQLLSEYSLAQDKYYKLVKEGAIKEAQAQQGVITQYETKLLTLYALMNATDEYYNLQADRIKRIIEAIKTNDIFALIKIGFEDALRDASNYYNELLQVGKNITEGMTNAFAEFFDVTSKGFMNFRELALSILQTIYRELLKVLLIEPLSKQIRLFVFGLLGISKHEGGPVVAHEGGYIPRFHLGIDEVPAILQTGERVLSRKQNQIFEDLAELITNAKQPRKEEKQVTIVNVLDPHLVGEYLSTSQGQQMIVNAISRQSGKIKKVLWG